MMIEKRVRGLEPADRRPDLRRFVRIGLPVKRHQGQAIPYFGTFSQVSGSLQRVVDMSYHNTNRWPVVPGPTIALGDAGGRLSTCEDADPTA